jgi:hypothetical protein
LPGQDIVWRSASASSPSAVRQALVAVEGLDEMEGQFGNVLAPVLERGHADRDHVEPVVELLAEAALARLGREVAVRRRDHADVDAHLVGAAGALELLFGQHAQDLRLGAERHVGHLVEIDHAAMRLFEKPGLHPARGAFAAEEHLFHPVGLDRGRADRDEGTRGAVGARVDVARGRLLAAARRAREHHPPVRARDLVELGAQGSEGGAAAHHHGGRDVATAERGVLAAKARGLHRAADHHHELVDVEGLLDEVVGALLDRGDRDLDVAMARDDDHRHVGVVAPHALRMSMPSIRLSLSQMSRIMSDGGLALTAAMQSSELPAVRVS